MALVHMLPLFSVGSRRKVLYQRAPRNIHRHVVLSEVKEAVAALPPVRELCNIWGPSPHTWSFERWDYAPDWPSRCGGPGASGLEH